MHISTAASPVLAGSEKEAPLQKRPSDVLWYVFLVALLSILLLAQPDQPQSTAQKSTTLVTGSTMPQMGKPTVIIGREFI